MAASIHTGRILRELDQLWAGLGSEPQADGSVGVLRAGALTMFLLTSRPEGGDPTQDEAYVQLLQEFPGRMVVVHLVPGEERSFDAKVSAQCWMPFGQRRHICVEQVDITTTRPALEDLLPVLRALRAPDLPAILWRRETGLLDVPGAESLLEVADKVILNSGGCGDPAKTRRRLLDWRNAGTLVADLSWTRLTRWRETIAQVFANPERAGFLRAIASVTVTYYGDRPPLRAAYLAAWLRNTLGGEIDYRLVSAGDREPCQADGEVAAAAISAAAEELTITQVEGESVEVRLGDFQQRTVFHELTAVDLLREELAIEGRDAVFDAALDGAGEFLREE